jgi:serine/threonine protein kinase
LPTEEQPTVISRTPPLGITLPIDAAPRLLQENLLPGTRLGTYELIDYVGGGGMGRVFRALDTSLGRVVALKILSKQQAADLETFLRFRNEARNAARLNHDNIVQVYFAGEQDGLPYIAFEFVEGMNLRMLVEQKGPLPLGEAISYTIQVSEALAHASERHVIHRDIKPSNLLITPDGRAKLIDMGLGSVAPDDQCQRRPHRQWGNARHVRLHLARAGGRSAFGRRS